MRMGNFFSESGKNSLLTFTPKSAKVTIGKQVLLYEQLQPERVL